jgi:amidase
MEGFIPDFDATIVTRLLDSGGTITGKLNMAGFSFGGAGMSGVSDYGRPMNPHNPAHATGESSSGSAAAVAGRYVHISFGGDQGGSIRIPASWCGVIGLKATYGLIPHTGVFGLDPTIDYVGPLALTTEDIGTALECVAGPDGYDPRQANVPAQLPKFTEAMLRGVEGLRVGVLSEGVDFNGNEAAVRQSVLDAVAILERAGAHVEEVSVPLHTQGLLALLPLIAGGLKRFFDTNLGGAFAVTYYPATLMTTFARFKQNHGHEFGPNIKVGLMVGAYLEQFYQGRLYAKAHNVRPTFVKQYNDAFGRVDVIAMPTVPITAPVYLEPVDYVDALDRTLYGGHLGLDISLISRNTAPFNLTGHPAISIPCGKSGDLPIGIQLVAPHFREDLLLRACYVIEHSLNWQSLVRAKVTPGEPSAAQRTEPVHQKSGAS